MNRDTYNDVADATQKAFSAKHSFTEGMPYFDYSMQEILQTLWGTSLRLPGIPEILVRNLDKVPIWMNAETKATSQDIMISGIFEVLDCYYYDIFVGLVSVTLDKTTPNIYNMKLCSHDNFPGSKYEHIYIDRHTTKYLHEDTVKDFPTWIRPVDCRCKLSSPGVDVAFWNQKTNGDVLLGRCNDGAENKRSCHIGVLKVGEAVCVYVEILKAKAGRDGGGFIVRDEPLSGMGDSDFMLLTRDNRDMNRWREIYDVFFGEYTQEDKAILDLVSACQTINEL